nr:putative RNA-directed DNA polymerase, eukaryota, reverse transcriptase zinc-binding domain protein [Tanacetum cinerariifolium]
MLWDYLAHSINQWEGEVVLMGDFNEVRFKSDRFGSIFNAQGANDFNSFITNVGLEEKGADCEFQGGVEDRINSGFKEVEAAESVCSGRFKQSEVPRKEGSFLSLIEEVVKVGKTVGYNMEGCSGADLLIASVYAPHDPRDKRMLWDYLAHSINQWEGEVVLMGDFNEVRFKSDRFGSIFNAQVANDFNSFITNAGLEEVQLGGSKYTWCHKSVKKMSKLDRFFISQNLSATCPNITAISLKRYLSDHRPILLHESSNDYGPVLFRFFHHWLELDSFNKFVIDIWNSAPGDVSNGIQNMSSKLKFTKLKIRDWINHNRNCRKVQITSFKEELRDLDALIYNGMGTDQVVAKRMEIINDMQHIDKLHNMDMTQKAKIKWDENSRFFHGILNKKRNQQNIRGVMIDGVWNEKPIDAKREFLLHFRNRFDKPADHRAIIDFPFPRVLNIDQQEDLDRDVTREEIKRAVWDCGTDKSLGPDGFTFEFFWQFWSTIENDVFQDVSHFFIYADIPKGSNSLFIALIPKVPGANLVKDSRPISLIGSLYKIITKVLANRLVGVLGDTVNEVQSAFIAERQILDGPFILDEIIQWCKLKKKQSLIFKVDFEKAFDSVRWDFLDDVLKNFGFGNKWCNWIQACLKSSRGSILVNGSPTDEF